MIDYSEPYWCDEHDPPVRCYEWCPACADPEEYYKEDDNVKMSYEQVVKDFLSLDLQLYNTCITKKDYVEQASALHIKYFGLQGNPFGFIEGIYMSMWDYRQREM